MREWLARALAPHLFAALDTEHARALQLQDRFTRARQSVEQEIANRVAETLLKMDPFEPFLKKYNVIFSEEWTRPEDRLSEQSQIQLYQWAYGMEHDPNFRHLTAWALNTQGNNTLRKATNEHEWFFGRACIVSIELFIREVRRLSSCYQEILLAKGHTFDPHATVEE